MTTPLTNDNISMFIHSEKLTQSEKLKRLQNYKLRKLIHGFNKLKNENSLNQPNSEYETQDFNDSLYFQEKISPKKNIDSSIQNTSRSRILSPQRDFLSKRNEYSPKLSESRLIQNRSQRNNSNIISPNQYGNVFASLLNSSNQRKYPQEDSYRDILDLSYDSQFSFNDTNRVASESRPLEKSYAESHSIISEDYVFSLKQKNIELQHLIYALKTERAKIDLETKRKENDLQSHIKQIKQQHEELLNAHEQLGKEFDTLKDHFKQIIQDKDVKIDAQNEVIKSMKRDLKELGRELEFFKDENSQLKRDKDRSIEEMDQARLSFEEKIKNTIQDLNAQLATLQQDKDILRMQLAEKDILMSQDFRNRNNAVEEMKLRHKDYTDQLLLMIDNQSNEVLHLKQQVLNQSNIIQDLHLKNQNLAHQLKDLNIKNTSLTKKLESDTNSHQTEVHSLEHEYKNELDRQLAILQQEFEHQIRELESVHRSEKSRTQKAVNQLVEIFMTNQYDWSKSVLDFLSSRNTKIHSLYTKVELYKQYILKETRQKQASLKAKDKTILSLKNTLKSAQELLSGLNIENEEFITLQKKMISLSIQ